VLQDNFFVPSYAGTNLFRFLGSPRYNRGFSASHRASARPAPLAYPNFVEPL